jgi:hypothetical protein
MKRARFTEAPTQLASTGSEKKRLAEQILDTAAVRESPPPSALRPRHTGQSPSWWQSALQTTRRQVIARTKGP